MGEKQDIVDKLANQDNYLANSRMDQPGEYATEVELFAMATLLNTSIWTYSPYSRQDNLTLYRWQQHSPIPRAPSPFPRSTKAIYLKNTAEHFEPALSC